MYTGKISFKTWEKLFIRGKTKGTYLAVISFALFATEILYTRLFLFYFIVSEIGAFTAFGVLVDFVSHLFNDQWKSPVTKKGWIKRFTHGRTHDFYGLIIEVLCFAIDGVKFPLSLAAILFVAPQFYLFYNLKFYH